MNFFVGIDYPLINGEIVSRLAEEAVRQHEDGKLGLIPVMPDGPHPLFAFYAKDCASAVRRCIETGSLRVQCIAAHNPICYFDMMEMQQGLGPGALQRNFINVNHVHDLKKIT
jgi:molybdopterin-guanine dinucleotide biosynthesis protein A